MCARAQNGSTLAQMVAVLESELAALHIWQSANRPAGSLAVPDEIWDGMTISIDKIETALKRTKHSNRKNEGSHRRTVSRQHIKAAG